MNDTSGSSGVADRGTPVEHWVPVDVPGTVRAWESTPEGWTHQVRVVSTGDGHYRVCWETADYRGRDYETPEGDIQPGPYVNVGVDAPTLKGALARAAAFCSAIHSTPQPHRYEAEVRWAVDEQCLQFRSVDQFALDWARADYQKERHDSRWNAQRDEVHAAARGELEAEHERRQQLLDDLEHGHSQWPAVPDISDEKALDKLIIGYMLGDIWILEFENRLEELLT
jgi:hypothetical protein